MFKTALLCLSLLLPATAIAAPCSGTNLIAAMDADTRAVLEARVDATPYAAGNFWRASRGGSIVHLVGTYHFDDPRHDAIVTRLAPFISDAAAVLVEAGPDEQEKLNAEMVSRPDRIFIADGPTLPDRLEEADWQALLKAMTARGIPGFMAAKMQPWYVSMMLGIPPCAMEAMSAGTRGLDARIMERAEAEQIPIVALEPYDTVFALFDAMPEDVQLEMIRSALAVGDQAEDYSATLTDAYFAENVRLTWELGRHVSYELPGKTHDEVDAELAVMEEALMNRRNRAWISVIETAAANGPIFVAFGALHMSGEQGVLSLLEQEGFTIERLAFTE